MRKMKDGESDGRERSCRGALTAWAWAVAVLRAVGLGGLCKCLLESFSSSSFLFSTHAVEDHSYSLEVPPGENVITIAGRRLVKLRPRLSPAAAKMLVAHCHSQTGVRCDTQL